MDIYEGHDEWLAMFQRLLSELSSGSPDGTVMNDEDS